MSKKNCILTLSCICPVITLDELTELERELRRRVSCSSISLTITAARANGVIPLRSIIKICALAFGVQEEDIPGKSRTQQNSFARHAYCHLAKMAGYKLEQIGLEVGRSHCTVLASVRTSENLIASKYGYYVRPFEAAKKMVEEYGRTAAPASPQGLNVNNPGQAAGAARDNE